MFRKFNNVLKNLVNANVEIKEQEIIKDVPAEIVREYNHSQHSVAPEIQKIRSQFSVRQGEG